MSSPVLATYGHGTQNDFFLFFDPENELELTSQFIQKICSREDGVDGAGNCYGDHDRRLGADGIIRIVEEPEGSRAKYFMDYRNADGSLAQMCGNGIRVMARYLVQNHIHPEGIFSINTRSGLKFLSVPEKGEISVNMGGVTQIDGEITVSANHHTWNSGVNIDVGNPHAVVQVESLDLAGDLIEKPVVTPAEEYPEGVNVEFIKIKDNNEIDMRVYERGVGETRSCGTGTCAVALAATIFTNQKLPVRWFVNPLGGRLTIDIDSHSNATMTGDAILVKEIDLTQEYNASLVR